MIEIENLIKTYGNLMAVDRLNLKVTPGQVFGFLGPNGAGKTSTIKMMAGLIKPNSGLIRIAGVDVQAEPAKAKAIMGYIPDRPYFYSELTGLETLRLVASLYEMEPKAAR